MLSSEDTRHLINQVEAKTKSPGQQGSAKGLFSLSKRRNSSSIFDDIPGAIANQDKNHFSKQEASHNDQTNSNLSATPPLPATLNYIISSISQVDHLFRLKAVLTYSDRYGGWIGLKNFINLYFSTVFHAFFGKQIKMHIIHVEKRKKFCAHFSLRSKGAYRIIIMLNYSLWDKILLSSSALPDLYFHCPDRSYLDKAVILDPQPDSIYVGKFKDATNPLDETLISREYDQSASTRWYEVSVSALCLIHRLEMIMFNDLRYNHASHVVTLGKFFANNNESKNPFVVSLVCD